MINCGIHMTNQSKNGKIFTKKEQQILIALEQPSTSGVQTSAPFHLDAVGTSISSTPLTSAVEKEFEMLPEKKEKNTCDTLTISDDETADNTRTFQR